MKPLKCHMHVTVLKRVTESLLIQTENDILHIAKIHIYKVLAQNTGFIGI